jgi:hypothetical protein
LMLNRSKIVINVNSFIRAPKPHSCIEAVSNGLNCWVATRNTTRAAPRRVQMVTLAGVSPGESLGTWAAPAGGDRRRERCGQLN